MYNAKLIVGAVAYDPKAVTIWEGIKDFFIENECPMDFVLFSNYEIQVDALLQGYIDIAWDTNLAFIKLDHKLEGKSLLLAMRDTDVDFKTRMIVRADSGINSLDDLRSKKIAFGSADSVQAAIMPEYCLKQQAMDAEIDYRALRFNSDVGKHGDTGRSEHDVVAAVLNGSADAGAIGEPHWNSISFNPDLKSIWTSPGYSHCVFNALPELDTEAGDAFVSTLMLMDWENPAHRRILELEGLKQWVPGSRQGYELVSEAVASCYHCL